MAESLLLLLHGDLLRDLSTELGVHLTGLQQGARLARRRDLIDNKMAKKLTLIGHAFNVVRHLTAPGCQQFLGELHTALSQVPSSLEQAALQATDVMDVIQHPTLDGEASDMIDNGNHTLHVAASNQIDHDTEIELLTPAVDVQQRNVQTTTVDNEASHTGEQMLHYFSGDAGRAAPFGGELPGHTPHRGSQAPALIGTMPPL